MAPKQRDERDVFAYVALDGVEAVQACAARRQCRLATAAVRWESTSPSRCVPNDEQFGRRRRTLPRKTDNHSQCPAAQCTHRGWLAGVPLQRGCWRRASVEAEELEAAIGSIGARGCVKRLREAVYLVLCHWRCRLVGLEVDAAAAGGGPAMVPSHL